MIAYHGVTVCSSTHLTSIMAARIADKSEAPYLRPPRVSPHLGSECVGKYDGNAEMANIDPFSPSAAVMKKSSAFMTVDMPLGTASTPLSFPTISKIAREEYPCRNV